MKVSVIIPTYNRADSLGRAIDSVCSQTKPVDEIIIVDDGSTDKTRSLVEAYGDAIKYIYQENSGKPGVARNVGIKQAKGDWIAFLDSDDVWLPTKIEQQLNLIDESNHSAGIVFSDYEMVMPDGTCSRSKVFNKQDLELLTEDRLPHGRLFHQKLFFYYLIYKNPIHTSCVLIKRDLLTQVKGFDPSLRIAEDRDLWIRGAKEAKPAYLPEVTCKYTHEGGNITLDKLLYAQSVSDVVKRYYNENEHAIPDALKASIKANLATQYRGISFFSAKAGRRSCAIRAAIASLKYSRKNCFGYVSRLVFAVSSPKLYAMCKSVQREKLLLT